MESDCALPHESEGVNFLFPTGTSRLFLYASTPEQIQAKQWPLFIQIPACFLEMELTSFVCAHVLFAPVALLTLTFLGQMAHVR